MGGSWLAVQRGVHPRPPSARLHKEGPATPILQMWRLRQPDFRALSCIIRLENLSRLPSITFSSGWHIKVVNGGRYYYNIFIVVVTIIITITAIIIAISLGASIPACTWLFPLWPSPAS